jgi:hypothetical protein
VHADLEQWKERGENFDYLGFRVFFVKEGVGPNLLLVHGYPFNSYDCTKPSPEPMEKHVGRVAQLSDVRS